MSSCKPDGQRDAVGVERRRAELLGAPPLGDPEEGQDDERHDGAAADPVANRALDDREIEDAPRGRSHLERVDEDVGVDDGRVERERERADAQPAATVEVAMCEPEERH